MPNRFPLARNHISQAGKAREIAIKTCQNSLPFEHNGGEMCIVDGISSAANRMWQPAPKVQVLSARLWSTHLAVGEPMFGANHALPRGKRVGE